MPVFGATNRRPAPKEAEHWSPTKAPGHGTFAPRRLIVSKQVRTGKAVSQRLLDRFETCGIVALQFHVRQRLPCLWDTRGHPRSAKSLVWKPRNASFELPGAIRFSPSRCRR